MINIIAYKLLFAAEPNIVLMGFMFWGIFTFVVYGSLYGFDKIYKRDYKDKNIYNLRKSKWLFCFYKIKSGKITKPIFWLNIVAHIIIFLMLVFNIAYAFDVINNNSFLGILFIILFGLIAAIIIMGQRYKSKLEKKKKYGKL